MKKLILPVSICLLLLVSLAVPATGAGSGAVAPQPQPLNGGRGVSLSEAGSTLPEPVALRYDPNPIPVHVDAPTRPDGGLLPQSASFVIDYIENTTNAFGDNCATFPAEARPPMEAAAAIWAGVLNSPVPIRIEACFAPLGAFVLGHSATLNFFGDFSGAPNASTWYPVSLANALNGSDLDPGVDDMSIAYATGYQNSFYYGTDGNAGSKTDFESVVLHEIGHGLGFAGSMRKNAAANTITWGYCGNSCPPSYPFSYDRFTVNNGGSLLISTYAGYPTYSAGLYSDLTSGSIFFTGANARAANGGSQVPLYAPGAWAQGSSYSHLAESFNGTANALMTYSIGPGESIHAPGAITMGVLKDVGWNTSTVTVAAPTNLVVTPISSAQVNLSWTDNGAGETGFRIERSPNDTAHWGVLTTTGTPATAYSDTSAIEGTKYYYRVSAAYPGPAYSSPSPAISGITPLKAVTGLTATPVSPTQINLAWTDTNTTESGYLVERSPNGVNTWTVLGTTGANEQACNDPTLSEATHYYYRVSAVNPTLGATASSPAVPADAITYLIAPTGLTAIPVSPSQVNLAWAQTSTLETGYAVSRGLSPSGPWTLLFTTAANAVAYNDISAVEGTAYYYEVHAVNLIPAVSLPAVTAAPAVVPLIAPTGLTAIPVSPSQVNLAWAQTSTHETGYAVGRGPSPSGPWTLLFTTAANAVVYNDTAAVEGSAYYYAVYAVNAVPAISLPAVTAAPAVVPLLPPTGVSAALGPAGQVIVSWMDVSAAETGYRVERSTTGGAPWTVATSPLTPAGATSFDDTAMPELSALTYRVTAVNAATTAESAPVVWGTVATPLAMPGNVAAVPGLGGGKILIQWDDVSTHETGYEIEWSLTGADGTWKPLIITAADANSYLWAQSMMGVYFIRIRTIDATPAHASVYVVASAVLDNEVVFVPLVKK